MFFPPSHVCILYLQKPAEGLGFAFFSLWIRERFISATADILKYILNVFYYSLLLLSTHVKISSEQGSAKGAGKGSVLFLGLFSLWACESIAFVCVCVWVSVCVCLCVYMHRLSPQVELWFLCFRSRSCYSGREWRQLCLQLKSWHTFTRIYYSYRSVSGRDLRPPVYLTNSPFCELSVHSKLCSHWWIEFLWALLTNILTEGQGQ